MNSENQSYHVLVIEDSITVRGVVAAGLAEKNISSEPAADAETGLTLFGNALNTNKPFDAILLDWHLPDHDGDYVVEKIRKEFACDSLPIMIYSERMEDRAYALCTEKNSHIDLQFKADLPRLPSRMLKFLSMQHVNTQDNIQPNTAFEVKILLVDDSPTQRMKYASVLQEQGYIIYEAESVDEGLEIAKKAKPLIAIIDYMMPEKTGEILVRELSLHEETTDCIAVIHSARNDIHEQVLKAGALDLLYKDDPINIFILRVSAIVNSALARQQHQQFGYFEQISNQMDIGFLRESRGKLVPINPIMENIIDDCPEVLKEIESLNELGEKTVINTTNKHKKLRSFIYTRFTLSDNSVAVLLQDNTLLAEKTLSLETALQAKGSFLRI